MGERHGPQALCNVEGGKSVPEGGPQVDAKL
jgi:hypothetical protein